MSTPSQNKILINVIVPTEAQGTAGCPLITLDTPLEPGNYHIRALVALLSPQQCFPQAILVFGQNPAIGDPAAAQCSASTIKQIDYTSASGDVLNVGAIEDIEAQPQFNYGLDNILVYFDGTIAVSATGTLSLSILTPNGIAEWSEANAVVAQSVQLIAQALT